MVHNSRHYLDKNVYNKLYQLFFEIISHSKSKKDFLLVINDILSPSERIMIAKRIAILYLLIKGINHTEIARHVKTSRATVAKFALLFYEKETKTIEIIHNLLHKKEILNFLKDIFAELFIEPGVKKGHWDLYWKHKKEQEDRKMID